MKKTKIVCTIGPSSNNEATMEQMLLCGMNVARLNFSHGTHETHREVIEMFRRVRDRLQLPAAVMLDTKGPEVRLRDFEYNEVSLTDGTTFTLTTDEILGNESMASVTYKDLPRQLKANDTLLIDDGRIHLKVLSTTDTTVECYVVHGGKLSNHK